MGDSSVAEEETMAAASKVEPVDDEGTPSSIESTPEPDALPELSQEPTAQPVKRKGGRKPVCALIDEPGPVLTAGRSMQPLKRESNVIDRRKLLSERDGPSTSSSSRLRSSRMKSH